MFRSSIHAAALALRALRRRRMARRMLSISAAMAQQRVRASPASPRRQDAHRRARAAICCSRCASAAASSMRSISMCCQDSRVNCLRVAAVPVDARQLARAVALHGQHRMHHDVDRQAGLASSTMPSESTRNGMSSTVTSTIVCVEVQPSRAGSGLKTRTSGMASRCACAQSAGARARRRRDRAPGTRADPLRRHRDSTAATNALGRQRVAAIALAREPAMRSMSFWRATGMAAIGDRCVLEWNDAVRTRT